jgi:4-amino-4-deoxy-L-arabinose transferase-like glycosyltransferase
VAGEADIDTRQLPVVGVAPRAAGQWRNDVLIASILGVLSFVLYIIPTLLWRPLFETPEVRVAVVAREMIKSGDYVIPTLGDEKRLNKPPLPYWLTAVTAKVIGGDDSTSERTLTRATEIPPAVLAGLAVFLIALYGTIVAGRTAGVMSALILGFSFIIARFSQLGYGDNLLMASCTGVFCSAAWMLCVPHAGIVSAFVFGICLGLGMLTKGHIPVVLVMAPLLIEVFIRRGFNGRKLVLFIVGLLVAACIAAPWYFVVESRSPGAWDTMVSGSQEGLHTPHHWHDDNYTFYITRLAAGLMPWTIVLLAAWPIYLQVRRKTDLADKTGQNQVFNEHFRFFFLAALMGFIAFYAWPKKQDYYLLPLMPAIALSSGFLLSRFKLSGGMAEERLAWWQLVAGLAIGVTIALIPACPAVAKAAQTTHGISNIWDVIAKVHLMLGWLLIPIGLGVIAFHFYSARQFAEGKVITAALPIAIIGFSGILAWSIIWTEKIEKSIALEKEAPRLRQELDALGDVTLYAAGNAPRKKRSVSAPMFIFYLQRPVHTIKKELAGGGTPPDGKKRVLVADRETVEKLGLKSYLPEGEDTFVVLANMDDAGWTQLSTAITQQKRTEEE